MANTMCERVRFTSCKAISLYIIMFKLRKWSLIVYRIKNLLQVKEYPTTEFFVVKCTFNCLSQGNKTQLQ